MSDDSEVELLFKNGIGIVYDIARLMSGQRLNIVAMARLLVENGFWIKIDSFV